MSSVVELAKRLHELESHARLLRSDVESLEATKRNIAISESTNTRAIELQRQSEEEAAEAEEASISIKRRSRLSAAQAKQRTLPLPQDFIDDVTHKASDVQCHIDEHRKLLEERDHIAALLENAEMLAQESEQEYVNLAELANVDENGNSAALVGLRKRNEYTDAMKSLVEAYRDRELLRSQLNHQSVELRRLASLIQDTANPEAQLAEAKEVLAEKQAKLAEMQRERVAYERVIHRKDQIYEKKPTGPTTEEIIRSANYDRRVALYELEKEGEQLQNNDAAIRHRAMQIAKCEKRLEMIGDAVAGDGLSEEERVDVELMDTLISEISALYKLRAEANIRMDMLDADVEKAEYKLDAIRQSIAGTRREVDNVTAGHERYRVTLQKEIEREQTLNAQEISRLENDVDALRKKAMNGKSKGRRSANGTKAR